LNPFREIIPQNDLTIFPDEDDLIDDDSNDDHNVDVGDHTDDSDEGNLLIDDTKGAAR
jgi:hypothetical protein